MTLEMQRSFSTRERILLDSKSLFTTKGVKGTSLADIANKSGISKGTLHYYFSSKDDIVDEVLNMHLGMMTDNISIALDGIRSNMACKTDFSISDIFQSINKYDPLSTLHLLLIGEATAHSHIYKEIFKDYYAQWENMVGNCLQGIKDLDCKDVSGFSRIILALFDGLSVQRTLGLRELEFKEIYEILSIWK